MEQKKKSNKQQRREIIAAVKRREAERRREMWHVRICWISIFVVGLIPGSVPALIAILNLDNDKVTFTNISLGWNNYVTYYLEIISQYITEE